MANRTKSRFKQNPQHHQLAGHTEKVFKPIELALLNETDLRELGVPTGQKLRVVNRKEKMFEYQEEYITNNEKKWKSVQIPATRPIHSLVTLEDNQITKGDGLISLFNHNKQGNFFQVRPKIVVCITCYNETRKQLQDSLSGLLDNLEHFKNAGIGNHELVVVIVYDGIDRMHTSQDNETNMISMYTDDDRTFNVDPQLSMKQQIKEFQQNVKYSALNVDQLRKMHDLTILKKDTELGKLVEKENVQSNLDLSKFGDLEKLQILEQLKFDSMDIIKKRAQQYIFEREKTSWVYQVRREVESIGIDQVNIKKKNNASKQQKELLKDELKSHQEIQDIIVEKEDQINLLSQNEDNQNYLYMFMCAKHKNGGKLSSHLWFFTGFCELFQPEYCVLVDCGLRPGETAIYDFFMAMQADNNIGGVCGFMGLRVENVYDDAGIREDGYDDRYVDFFSNFLMQFFDVQQAQVFEYNFAHIIDKPFESLFGFIHVLPGAFSGYRWEALKRDQYNESILDSYFKTVITKNFAYTSIEEANMYLAEDRILCLKLYCKFGQRYKLRYIPTAQAVVDPVTNLVNLLGQRRRWINGTWFALDYVLKNKNNVYHSNHSAWEIFWYTFSMYYAIVNKYMTYIIIGMFFATTMLIFEELFYQLTLQTGYGGTDSMISFNANFLFLYVQRDQKIVFKILNYNFLQQQIIQIFRFK